MKCSGVLPTTQFAYRNGLGTCDALLCASHTLQSALENGQEAQIVQIDFSAAFDRVNHLGILYKLCSVGIGGSVVAYATCDHNCHHTQEQQELRSLIRKSLHSLNICYMPQTPHFILLIFSCSHYN